MARSRAIVPVLVFCLTLQYLSAAERDASLALVPHLDALLKMAKGKQETFTLQIDGGIKGLADKAAIRIGKKSAREFYFSLDGPGDGKATLCYTPEKIVIELPAKNVVFLAEGVLPAGAEALNPEGIFNEALRMNSMVQALWPGIIQQEDSKALIGALSAFVTTTYAEGENASKVPGVENVLLRPMNAKEPLRFSLKSGAQPSLKVAWGKTDEKNSGNAEMSILTNCTLPEMGLDRKIVKVPREEMERSLQRGLMRAIGIRADEASSKSLTDGVVEISGARLEVKDGQRTCWLTGAPRDMGLAHGKLFAPEIRKLTDSTLYVVGFIYSVGKGSWFMNDIRDAWRRLEPHCDKDYLDELKGLAEGAGIAHEEMKLANVFPELFHCSGFAISGEATVGGKMYHGRVLDYMTEIGLQGVQVDFITRRDGCNGIVNVGYAGFIGCVSGMNDTQISLGEMGGRGEGNWDGTPMAFLMRRVLEKATTLEEAQAIFKNAKRTCEYYYLIADGKTRRAVGVAAWPEKIEFIKQGEAHPQLPNALGGCVLLSAGDRYKLLSQRTKDGYGKLDEQAALELMARPVAMGSNLHNVLFVPEDLTYHVAHASTKGRQPAATQPYVKHDLKANLKMLETVKKP